LFFLSYSRLQDAKTRTTHCNKLKNIFKYSSQNNDTILIISNTGVKNNIVTSVSYVKREYKIIMEIIHHGMNIMSTKEKLFAMRYSIGQASQIQGITYIIIVTDTIPAAKKIFGTSLYPYELYSIVIFNDLKKFFNKNLSNMISFWDYPSDDKWSLYLLVDKKSKLYKISPILPF